MVLRQFRKSRKRHRSRRCQTIQYRTSGQSGRVPAGKTGPRTGEIILTYILPPKIQAGVTFEACAALADYPAAAWVLTAHLRGPGPIDLTAIADGTTHQFAETAETTATWGAGVYSYVLRVTLSGEIHQVEVGTLEILADLAAVEGVHDTRTHAVKTLEAIEAVIERRATLDQDRYVINNRELWRTPIQDLLKLRDTYRAEVRREKAAKRGRSLWGPAVQVRI